MLKLKVITTKRFTDLKEDKVREIGDEFEVTKDRYKEVERFVDEVKVLKPKKQPKKKDK